MKKNGFTLVEMLIALTVSALVMLAVYMAMVMAQRTSAGVGRKVITQQDTRAVLDIMASEIAMASFNQRTETTIWSSASFVAATACGNVIPIPANRGIVFADEDDIFIAMDLGGPEANPGRLGEIGDAANEFIIYSYNPATRAISRRTNCGPPVPILGGTALGSNVINQEAGIRLFQYFDRNGQPLALPVNIPAIGRVRITIVAETAEIDLNTNRRKRMIYSTDVLVRNHMIRSFYHFNE